MHNLKRQKYIFLLLSYLFCLSFWGCREDIYDPNNKDSSINEPITISYRNSYSFLINARQITYYVADSTQIDGPAAQLSVSLDNYQAGYVEVYITDLQKNSVYSGRFNSNIKSMTAYLNGHLPERLALNFQNFSGNLRIDINSSF